MPHFSESSMAKLMTCHRDLQTVLLEAIEYIDFTIIQGHRTKEEQDRYYNEGRSTKRYPNSKHNSQPSLAVDIAPYPIDWKDAKRFYYLAGIVKGIGLAHGITIRWGGDWDSDNDFKDQNFNDLPHFEVVK